MCNVKLTPHWTVVLAKPLYRKRLFALQGEDMTLEKDLRSQHGKDREEVNELPTISASILVIAIS